MRDVVLDRCVPEPMSGCWLWLGTVNAKNGYGYAPLGRRSARQLAHRLSYEAFVGPIPSGLHIDHRCHNRVCVNPDHLEAVTQQVNNARQRTHTNHHAGKARCIHGHVFDEVNTYHRPGGGRSCRQCLRDRAARRSEEN